MKHAKPFAAILIFLLTAGAFQQACRKPDNDPGGSPGILTLPGQTSGNADTLSTSLLFLSSTKKPGVIPSAPASNGSVQISIKDTLYLTDQLPRVIKFRHTDASKNVSGVYIQILINGSASSFYYDVPELTNMSSSDSISVITIAIDPGNLQKPQTAQVKIVPYDKNKQPLVQITRPLKIDQNKVNLASTNSCSFNTSPNTYWRWEISLRTDDPDAFLSLPEKINSPQGQDITGSCCNGNSTYPLDCPGDTAGIFRRKLHFATYYKINFETFQFSSTGSFLRLTEEDSPVPSPSKSNFCAGGNGVVLPGLKLTRYDGTWTVSRSALPANKPVWLTDKDSLQVTLRTTSSTGTGFGNPGGVIHQLDCQAGSLVLVQLSRTGDAHLVKVYSLRQLGQNLWHD